MDVFHQIPEQSQFWTILATTESTQIAVMTLGPDQVSGEYGSEHPQADQVVYAARGSGRVRCEGNEVQIQAGDVVLIRAGEQHQVIGGPLVTLNVYGPPGYPGDG